MGLYFVNEAAFDLPDIGLVDRTEHRIEATLPGGDLLALQVHRQPIPEGASLGEVVGENLRWAERQLPAHSVVFRRESEIAGCPALEVGVTWKGEAGLVYTRQAHLDAQGTWIVFSGNAPLEEREACDALVERAVATFRLRD